MVPHRHGRAGPEIPEQRLAFPMSVALKPGEDLIAHSSELGICEKVRDSGARDIFVGAEPHSGASGWINGKHTSVGQRHPNKIGTVFDESCQLLLLFLRLLT